MYDLVAIGQALVDVIASVSDEFLDRQARQHGLKKGERRLIDPLRAVELYNALPSPYEAPGGSTANTAAGLVSFGGSAAYIGKVGADHLGEVFQHDMEKTGIHYPTAPLTNSEEPTGRCLILVTPDGERTMNTCLGAARELSPADIDETLIANAKITYVEGYLFDSDQARDAIIHAAQLARKHGKNVAFTLSDVNCVERYRNGFFDFIKQHTDMVFANENEILSLFESSDMDAALSKLMRITRMGIITRGSLGSMIVTDGTAHKIPALPTKVVDTTGAGDQYAAGFLYGYTRDMPLPECGRLGTLAATDVIGHVGPRPETDYSKFIKLK